SRVPVAGPQGTFYCESLVPVDFNSTPGEPQLLLDFEFNRLLAAVAKRTRSVAVILDCCHSTGATREVVGGAEARARRLDFPIDFGGRGPLRAELEGARATAAAAGVGGVDD